MRTGERGWQAGDAGWATELEIALTMELERAQPVNIHVIGDSDIVQVCWGIGLRKTVVRVDASQDCASPACYQCHDAGVLGG